MISSKRSTGKKKKWHCTLRNLGPKDSNKVKRNIKKVKPLETQESVHFVD